MAHAWRISKTSSAAPDAAAFASRAGTFGAAVRNVARANLIVVHDRDDGICQFITTSQDATAERVAGNASSAVGGRAGAADGPPPLDASFVVELHADPSRTAARETQAGATATQVAEYIGVSLPVGCWVGVSLRPPRKSEVSAVRRWYDFRLSGAATHHVKSGEVVVASLFAGGPDAASVSGVLDGVVSALPGFDVEARPVPLRGRGRTALPWLAAAVAVGVAGSQLHGWVPSVPAVPALWTAAAAAAPAVVAVAVLLGLLPSGRDRFARSVASGLLPGPGRRWLPARAPRRERAGSDGRVQQAFGGDYPLARSAFLVGPSVVLGLVSPHTGSSAGASSTQMRAVPPALRSPVGPYVGDSGSERVHISQADRSGGVAAFGLPNSGKSVLVQNIFAFDSLSRVRARAGVKSSLAGDVGAQNTLIAFESKGRDGVEHYVEWMRATGDAGLVIEVSDPSTPAIDMFDVPGSAGERAAFFVDAMKYAFGETDIGPQSANTLKVLFRAALLMTVDDVAEADLPAMSPVEIVSVLLSGRGDEVGVRLAGAFTARVSRMDASDPARAEAVEAVQRLSLLYGAGVTVSARRSLTSAPTSKIEALMSSRSWWDPSRPRVRWRDVIDGHWAVVVNTGQSRSGLMVDDTLTERLTAMLMFSLRHAIVSRCDGWLAAGRAVSVYSDELALLCGQGNSGVFTWMRDQGRSFGVRPVLATQRPDQLPAPVRAAVQSFSTFFWFGQNDPGTIAAAVADLSADGSVWSASDIATMEPHHAALRATVGKQRQPPVPMKCAFWGGRESEFAADQSGALP